MHWPKAVLWYAPHLALFTRPSWLTLLTIASISSSLGVKHKSSCMKRWLPVPGACMIDCLNSPQLDQGSSCMHECPRHYALRWQIGAYVDVPDPPVAAANYAAFVFHGLWLQICQHCKSPGPWANVWCHPAFIQVLYLQEITSIYAAHLQI